MRDDPTILVPGWMHEHALARLAETFDLVRIDHAEAARLAADLKQRVRGLASSTVIDRAFIDALPGLEIIAHYGVGYDAVDVRHAASAKVMVTNTPDVLTEEVADTAIGLLLNTVRELAKAEAYLRAGGWMKDDYSESRLTLRGRKVGIFGLGRIGLAVARRIEAFGLPISYHNRRPVESVRYRYYSTLLDLAREVDTLICVAPGGASTRKAVDAEILAALGADGVFINIGRGSTVDEDALLGALRNGTIGAAGLDVFSDEPNVPQAFLDLESLTMLPHVGSASRHTRRAMGDVVVDNLCSWFTRGVAVTPVPETASLRRR